MSVFGAFTWTLLSLWGALFLIRTAFGGDKWS